MLSHKLLDGKEMALTGPALPTKLSQRWAIFLTNQIYLFVYLVSMAFSSQILAVATHVKNINLARNLNPVWRVQVKRSHLQAKIRTQNHLHWTINQNLQEWIDACRDTTKAINEAKTESWIDLVQDAMSNSDVPNMWKVISGLNGTPDANSPNEAMSHNGQTITDIRSKANTVINHYARVTKVNMSQDNLDITQKFKKHLNAPSVAKKSLLYFKWVIY